MESRKLFCNKFPKLKKWSGGLVIVTLAIILFFSYSLNGSANPKKHSAYDFFHSSPSSESHKDIQSPMQSKTPKKPHLVNLDGLDQLYGPHNISSQDSKALLVWPHMRSMLSRSDALPETAQGVKEASMAWKDLILTIEDKKVALMLSDKGKVKAEDEYCPFSVDEMKTISLLGEGMVVELPLPCGLVEDSSISLVGVPDGTHKYNTFQIKLLGSQLPGKEKAPIVLQYNVSLAEEEEEPFIVQNTWTHQLGWGTHQKCPPHPSTNNPKVDGLVLCNKQAFRSSSEENQSRSGASNDTSQNVSKGIDHESATFPFSEGIPFIATLWVGAEGFHMTVNGRHETSFAYREKLEPWLVSKVKVLGGLKLLSALAKGLPVSEDHDVVIDSERLKAPSVSKKRLIMLIGVFSTGNNFERRMALRRSWMQYEAVRSGDVAVRFFVGLHKNKQVNYELWREAQAYGDIQLMPFVDYYTLISLKTIAICIMGTKILPSKYIMKTDDDAFVRIDEILSSLKVKPSDGLLYGLISFDSSPHRDKESKWYISDQEWPPAFYPPWAHGPGYVISRNIAKFIVRGHQQRDLKLFKLEDVAMGIWMEEFKKSGERVEYVTDERFHNAGCHYQSPRLVLCLWENLQKQLNPICCD